MSNDDQGRWVARLPVGRVVRLEAVGAAAGAGPGRGFAAAVAALDPLPDTIPAVLVCRPGTAETVPATAEEILDELERAALRMFPAWLPEPVEGRSSVDVRAARIGARRLASGTRHAGPFVVALAEAAVLGTRVAPRRFAQESRAAGLARVLAAAYGRAHTALLITAEPGASAQRQQVVATVAEWFADRAGAAVGLDGAMFPDVDRFPGVDLPPDAADPQAGGTDGTGAGVAARAADVYYPAPTGQPHPGSRAEQRLAEALRGCEWAYGGEWNTVYRPDPLRPPIRVDLIWRNERCVVELDGDEHRVRDRFAADRRRDVRLQLDGYGVLRFTNDQVFDDLAAVLADIEQYVTGRRRGTGQPGPAKRKA